MSRLPGWSRLPDAPVWGLGVRDKGGRSSFLLDAFCVDHIARFEGSRPYEIVIALPKTDDGMLVVGGGVSGAGGQAAKVKP
jgi:hypothetical protein